jgi:hypothetical protein
MGLHFGKAELKRPLLKEIIEVWEIEIQLNIEYQWVFILVRSNQTAHLEVYHPHKAIEV